ncbi:MAG: UDP-N-acetylmuramoyl-tripeptide--D-alanyl-D-alanine ligase [Planctomycetota bacterium]|nr:MAG: UDP-N-acetylmuramoyl-tripeptide--D-alanyl-D-alanine ligase [Planctomycetota bacterium]
MHPIKIADIAAAAGGAWTGPQGVVIRGIATDSRAVRSGDLFVAIVGQRLDGHHFLADALRAGAAACLVERECAEGACAGLRDRMIVVDDTIAALGRLGGWYRRTALTARTTVIGVTGSNGKTTTKLMIDHVLAGELAGRASERSFNNAIGVPLTLLSAEATDDYLVVEIGTSAPGEIDALSRMAQPDVAVITSIGAAHLAGLGDVASVAAEKASILRHVRRGGLAAVNIDAAEILPHLPGIPAPGRHRDRVRGEVAAFPGATVGRGGLLREEGDSNYRLCTVGRNPQADLFVTCIEGDLDGTSFVLDGDTAVRLRLPGAHHATNAALAYAVARWMGLTSQTVGERLYEFVPPSGRTRRVDFGDVTLIDDAYNANPSSMRAALDILSSVRGRRRVFVMGEMKELGSAAVEWHRKIGEAAARAGVDLFIAAGAHAHAAAQAAASAGVSEIVLCDDAGHAADLIVSRVGQDDVILVKGSRAAGLEVVVQRLESALSGSRLIRAAS